jgi:hypothetical protein
MGGLRVQSRGVLRVDELSDRVRQVPVTSQLAKFGHCLLIGAEADGNGCHTIIVRRARAAAQVISGRRGSGPVRLGPGHLLGSEQGIDS